MRSNEATLPSKELYCNFRQISLRGYCTSIEAYGVLKLKRRTAQQDSAIASMMSVLQMANILTFCFGRTQLQGIVPPDDIRRRIRLTRGLLEKDVLGRSLS